MSLFQLQDTKLASGVVSKWKIECDALSPQDWATLAHLAAERLPPFGRVEGVPRGGLRFAEALKGYCILFEPTLLIADDVGTTGGSMEKHRNGRDAIGIVAFSRGGLPTWIESLFVLQDNFKTVTERDLALEKGRKFYEAYVDNGSIHSNRMPTWRELMPMHRLEWIRKAEAAPGHGGRPTE